MFRAGFDEVHEAGAAVKLSKKDGGVGLRIRGFDPLKARSDGTVFTTSLTKNPTSITAHPHFRLFLLKQKCLMRKLEREIGAGDICR